MLKATPYNSSTAVDVNTTSVSFKYAYQGAAQFNVTDGTPGAKTFASSAVNTTTDAATITAHGYVTGLVGQLTTDGSLPAGLSTSTNYYIIVVDANTVKFASSAANAVAGTAIDLTTQGSGNDTFTPTALSVTCKMQASNDDVDANYTDISGATGTLTADGVAFMNLADQGAAFVRGVISVASGYPSVKLIVSGKERNL